MFAFLLAIVMMSNFILEELFVFGKIYFRRMFGTPTFVCGNCLPKIIEKSTKKFQDVYRLFID
jgi:hypothetical protein